MKAIWPIHVPKDQQPDPEKKKLLYGEGDGLSLFPLKHVWAWDAYNDMQENHWRPNSIQMTPDVACWKNPRALLDEERRLFWLTFGRLTTMDLLRVNSLALLARITSSPEVAMAFDWMNAQERLHSESYQWCVDELDLSYGETYGLYKHIASIRHQVEFSEQVDQNFGRLVEKYEQGNADLLSLAKGAIVTSFFWFMMFEGVWFVANLSGGVQSLYRRGKMSSTAEQFQYIRRDEDRHILLGRDYIAGLVKEHPDAWDSHTKNMCRMMAHRAIGLEQAFIDEALPDPILGYSAEGHMEYVKFLANMRCRSLGLEEHYPGVTNPFPWIAEIMEHLKEKNFFETHVQEYRSAGSLRWD